ncbi:MAG: hypothetical protein ABI131_04085 [Nostocoides sp.]
MTEPHERTDVDVPRAAPAGSLPEPPETGDLVIDAALSDLAGSDPDDLAAQLWAGERVDQTLRSRLAELGG